MRILVLLGCLATAATAYAQPADPDVTPGTPGTPGEPSPPSAQPSQMPSVAPAAPCAAAPDCSSVPVAPPGMVPVAPTYVTEMDSYRWQITLADVSAVSLLLAGKSGTTSSIAGLTYLLAGPIIHGAHGQGGRVAASLGLRLVLPLVSGIGFAALAEHNSHCTPEDDDCDSGALFAALFGFTLGAVSAMVLDATVVARPVEIHRSVGPTWAPQIAMTPGRTTFGVVGRF